MARREARPPAEREVRLIPLSKQCVNCGEWLWVAYHAQRTLMLGYHHRDWSVALWGASLDP